MQREKSALFLGRFQPPHRGHEKAMAWMLLRHGRLVVAIGSSNKKMEKDNPLAAKEREKLLRKIILSHKLWRGRVKISFVPDFEAHEKWMAAMLRKFPAKKFEFYANNRLVQRLFSEKGFAARPNPEFGRNEMEGRKIRELARKGRSIAGRLPKAVRMQAKKIAKIIARCQLAPIRRLQPQARLSRLRISACLPPSVSRQHCPRRLPQA